MTSDSRFTGLHLPRGSGAGGVTQPARRTVIETTATAIKFRLGILRLTKSPFTGYESMPTDHDNAKQGVEVLLKEL